jgi:hypothetical protein
MLGPPPKFIPPLGPPRLSAREQALAQLRGYHLGALEKAATLHSRSAAELMPGVLKELRIDRRLSESEIVKVWNHLIDPNIVKHAQPRGLHKGTLFVSVDSDVWRSEIVRYRRHEILERLQHAFGSDLIRKLSFRVE